MRNRRLSVHAQALIGLSLLISGSAAQADDTWIQIGNGIEVTGDQEANGKHRESGRLAQVAWAWDNVQGRNALWAGASHGGLWKTLLDASGKVYGWATVTDNFPGSHTLGSFAIRKGNSDDIVIGTGAFGWGNGNGIYYTTNGGTDWTLATLCPPSGRGCGPATATRVSRIVADRADSTGATLVAATSSGIWGSFDFGQTWYARLTGKEASDVVQDTGDLSRWYAGVVNHGIYLSKDYAASWNAHGTGINGSIARISLAACDIDPNYLYAIVVNSNSNLNGVYRSAKGGSTWVKIYSRNKAINLPSNGQGGHTCSIACDPSNPDHIVFALVKPIEVTNATTADATSLNKIVPFDGGHADYNFLLFAGDGAHLHIANDGGYYLYDYTTQSVNDYGNILGLNVLELGGPKTEGYSTLQGGLASSWSKPEEFVAGLQDDGVARGNISQNPAIHFVAGGDGRHVSIMPADSGVFGFVHNGSSQRNVYNGNVTPHIEPFDFELTQEKSCPMLIDPTPGLAQPVVFTADQNVRAPSGNLTSSVYFNDVLSPSSSWAVVGPQDTGGTNSLVSNVDVTVDLKSYEIVATLAGWTGVLAYIGRRDQLGSLPLYTITPPLPPSPAPTEPDARINADKSPQQPHTLYYTSGVGSPRRAYLSRDGGAHWTDVAGDIVTASDNAGLLKLIGNPAEETQLFLATTKGVFRSDDGGTHWRDYSEGLRFHEQVDDIVINSNPDKVPYPTLYVATHGRGFWQRTICPGPGLVQPPSCLTITR